MSNDEKRCCEKLAYQRMKTKLEIFQIHRDEFRSHMREGDAKVHSYFEHSISDEALLKEFKTRWSYCIKKDETHIEENR